MAGGATPQQMAGNLSQISFNQPTQINKILVIEDNFVEAGMSMEEAINLKSSYIDDLL